MTLFHWQSIIYTSYYTIPGYIRTLSRPSRICSGIAPQRKQLFIAVQSSQDKMTNSCMCPQYIPHIWRSCGTFTSVFAVLSGTMTETSTSSVSFALLGAWNKWKGTRIISIPTSHSLAYLDGLKFQVCILQFRCSRIFFGHHQFHQWTPWKSCIEICPVLTSSFAIYVPCLPPFVGVCRATLLRRPWTVNRSEARWNGR